MNEKLYATHKFLDKHLPVYFASIKHEDSTHKGFKLHKCACGVYFWEDHGGSINPIGANNSNAFCSGIYFMLGKSQRPEFKSYLDIARPGTEFDTNYSWRKWHEPKT